LNLTALNDVIKEPFDLAMNYGCLHSIKTKDRGAIDPFSRICDIPPKPQYSLDHPPRIFKYQISSCLGNIDPEEAKEQFSKDVKIHEERNATREKIVYLMERFQPTFLYYTTYAYP
jgi:hypothetical protein